MTRAGFEYVLDKHVPRRGHNLCILARSFGIAAPAAA